MARTFPFSIPEHLHAKLPPPSSDGYVYADVKFHGRWDGILVIDADRQCVGVYCGRRILIWPLPFTPEEIEDVRRACLWNRFLASFPESLEPYKTSVLAIWIACPILLALGVAITPWLLPVAIALAALCIFIMYSAAGFPFTRLPSAIVALGFALLAVIWFIQSFK